MHNEYYGYNLPYYPNTPMYSLNNMYRSYNYPYYPDMLMYNNPNNIYRGYPHPYYINTAAYSPEFYNQFSDQYVPFTNGRDSYFRSDLQEPEDNNLINLMDYGPEPFVVNIDEATKQNSNFRTALWTGTHLQVTLMSIEVDGEIGLEMHPDTDQFIRVEDGMGVVRMGSDQNNLDFERRIRDDFAVMVPAGTWHNIVNTGSKPLKVYSIYAPPHHPQGTVHRTKADAEAAETENSNVNNTRNTRSYW